jgi:hypothetical protein
MKNISFIVAFLQVSLLISCTPQKTLFKDSANYEIWAGGQESVGGVNFVFKIVTKSDQKVSLDSIFVDDTKINKWEIKTINDTIAIYAFQNFNNKPLNSLNKTDKPTKVQKIVPKNAYTNAKLFFSNKKGTTIIYFDKINKSENVFYQ